MTTRDGKESDNGKIKFGKRGGGWCVVMARKVMFKKSDISRNDN